MEYQAVFEERIPLSPKEINRLADDTVETILIEKLKNKLERRCSKHGYVLPGSIEIISRSMGHVEVGRFTGDIVYQVQAQGKVLNPSDGMALVGEILKKNKMGVYVEYKDAIRVLLPRDLHIANEKFDNLQIGDTIETEIKKSRFQVNDTYILCVGLFKALVNSSDKQEPVVELPPVEEEEDEEEAEEDEEQAEEDEEQAEEEVDAEDSLFPSAPGSVEEETT